MSTKHLGTAASNNDDLMDKADVTAAINAADGNGLTDNGSGVLSVGAGTGITVNADDVAVTAAFRTLPISFHLPGAQTTGVKTPEFISPVAGTITPMRGRCSAGSAVTYRLVKNGASNMDTSAGTGTSVVSTTLSTNNTVAAGDRIQLEVVNAGSGGTNLSVTAALLITGA
jgi:hypothetical protein